MKTTLNAIRECGPCKRGWEKLLKGLGKTKGDDEPLDLLTILEINGLDDALWCLQAVKGYDKELRLFAVSNAKRVRHLIPEDELEKFDGVLEVASRYANGEASREELASAEAYERAYERASARNYARASARASAWASAWNSVRASTWDSMKEHFKIFLEETK